MPINLRKGEKGEGAEEGAMLDRRVP